MPTYQPSTYNFYADQYQNPTQVASGSQNSGKFDVGFTPEPFNFGQQAGQSTDFRNRFSSFLGELETPEATRDRFANRYGYEDLADQYFRSSEMMGNLGSAINAAPENIKQRTSGTMTTQSQLANIQNKEVGELMKVYSQVGAVNEQQGQRLAYIEQNLNQAAQLELAQQSKIMQPWMMEYEDNAIVQARQYSGYTFANQMELERLLANQQAGLTWSNAEAERANQLAIAEKTFENNLRQVSLRGEEDRKTKQAPTDLATLWSSIMG